MLQPPATSAPRGHAPPGASWSAAAQLADLRGEGPFALSGDGLDLVVVRTASGLRAFQGRCPHQGALLGEGELDGEALVCRNRRWRDAGDVRELFAFTMAATGVRVRLRRRAAYA